LKSWNPLKVSRTSERALEEKVKSLPIDPGVYLFKDAHGKIIYIGKAVILRNRVRQYFQAESDGRYQFEALVQHIADVEVIVTDSELEALILENNLIREHKPRYNIDLRDDKSFPFLRITNEPFPRIFLTRRPVNDGSKYFGPFSDLFHLKGLIRVLRGMLKIRSCNLALEEEAIARQKFKVCLQFHIGRCNAPCIANESRQEYLQRIRDFSDIVAGKGGEAIERLYHEMELLAQDLKFELAAQLRDWLSALENLKQRQKMISAEPINRDVFGLALEDDDGCLVIFQVRSGRMLGRLHYRLKQARENPPEEILEGCLERFYSEPVQLPDSVLLPSELPHQAAITGWLKERAGFKVDVMTPQRGDKAGLVDLANRNAKMLLDEARLAAHARTHISPILKELQKQLNLKTLPKTIAAFDISTLQGTDKVASMVVFESGKSARSQYRHFKITTVEGMDDFASMKEVISRRFGRLKREDLAFPDLILIDGGKGQLNAACEALAELNISDQTAIGLAKRLEEIYFPGNSQPFYLPRTSSALKLLQQVRDEAHRFAITFHRQLRQKRSLRSVLDDIEGVGPARRKSLMKRFGSIKQLKTATVAQIEEADGIPPVVAERVYHFFHNGASSASERQSS
jgi:excinuclease ABC subunit C